MIPVYRSFNLTAQQWLSMPRSDRYALAMRVFGNPAAASLAFTATNAACLRDLAAIDPLAAVLSDEPWGIYAYESVYKAGGCAAWRSFNPQVKRAHFDRWADGTGVEWTDLQASTIEHLADMACARIST